MPENTLDAVLYWFIGIVAAIILLGLLVVLCMYINDFSRELKYLKSEIGRTSGAERRYWLRRKRKLWLSLIPFVKY